MTPNTPRASGRLRLASREVQAAGALLANDRNALTQQTSGGNAERFERARRA